MIHIDQFYDTLWCLFRSLKALVCIHCTLFTISHFGNYVLLLVEMKTRCRWTFFRKHVWMTITCCTSWPHLAIFLSLDRRRSLEPTPFPRSVIFPFPPVCHIPCLSISSSSPSPQSPHPSLPLSAAQGNAVLQALITGPGRKWEVGQKVVLETAGKQGWNIE